MTTFTTSDYFEAFVKPYADGVSLSEYSQQARNYFFNLTNQTIGYIYLPKKQHGNH